MTRHSVFSSLGRVATLICVIAGIAAGRELPGPRANGKYLLPNGWSVSPAGNVVGLPGIAAAMDVAPDGRVAVACDMLDRVRICVLAPTGDLRSTVDIRDGAAALRWWNDSTIFVAGGRTGCVYRIDVSDAGLRAVDSIRVGPEGHCAVLALDCDRDFLYTGVDSTLVIASLALHDVVQRIPLEGTCRAIVRSATRRVVYATLWDAALTVTVSLDSMRVANRARVGGHPCSLVEDGKSGRLYVACSNDDLVAVLDAPTMHITHVLSTAAFTGPRGGALPMGLALTQNAQFLAVANAGCNALVMFDVRDTSSMGVIGWIPAGRSPIAVAIRGKRVIAANAYGLPAAGASGADWTSQELRGTVTVATLPTAVENRRHTETVLANIPYFSSDRVASCQSGVVPDSGQPSKITHVFLVVKDGRSYDEIFGDVPGGNGDSTRCLFPAAVTPNHHAIASEFVLCDNVYTDALVHEEAHHWLMGAMPSDALRTLWPANRGKRGQRWLFTGESALMSPVLGFIWDFCDWKRVRIRVYGEFTETRFDTLSFGTHGVEDNFSGTVCQSYPSYDRTFSDTARIAQWEKELGIFESKGLLPGLTIIHLANDREALRDPSRMVDNDRALGMLVDRISQSPFWNQSAIFVVEADADGASDHVNPHRVPLMIISPYARRGMIDSTMYTTSSILKTIERMLGLPAMSHYDEAATLMCAPFQETRNDEPYDARPVPVNVPARRDR